MSDEPLSVGFVGLGSMGGRMVQRLLAGGHRVTGWNRSAVKAEGLAEKGMARAPTPREAAEGADVVLSIVTDTAAVEQVASGEEGIIAGLRPGAVYADMSTIAPDASRSLASNCFSSGGNHVVNASK